MHRAPQNWAQLLQAKWSLKVHVIDHLAEPGFTWSGSPTDLEVSWGT